MPIFQSVDERNTLIPTMIFAIGGFLGIDIHLASLPAIMQFMHTNKAHMQQSVSIYLLGMGVSMLFYGPLSDRYGRRPLILFGLGLACIFSFVCMFTETIHEFLLTRLLQGLGTGVCLGLGRTIISDVLQGARFAIMASRLSLIGSVVPLLAPMLGGYLQHLFGWQANFFAFGLYLLLAFVIFAVFCPETNTSKNPDDFKLQNLFSHYREILKHRLFLTTAALSGIAASIPMVYSTLSPFIYQVGYHLTPVVYGWIVSALAISSLVGRVAISPMIHQFGRLRSTRYCVYGFFLASLLMAAADLGNLLILSVFIILSALSIFTRTTIAPIFSSYAMDIFPAKRGVAGSLYGSAQMLISFVISGFAGLFSSDGLIVLIVSNLLISFVLVALTGLMKKHV